ncbi:hypothetical protein PR003_g8097 [Phytophthora rubi]|uniref:Uncharacterized protein n=1 Tax=Phytophthora rubi TaxID=129364 RepID=A0A6A3MSX1_9STRA|nr:hypothetical protein PR002_g8111 [Phytophthora rubi]KAE9036106.1 hypothetical protein PR001_g8995 [Phytophthora rubi]KAE9345142.1 hypothetical protein PR003_g8097 [Phytophthora rubi]
MTTLTRGNVSSVKKAASTAEAPVWKSYLAIRSPSASEAEAANAVKKSAGNGISRGRKRSKPSLTRGGTGAAIWMSLATPLTSGDGEDGAAELRSIRRYWEQLSVNERQQILFLDEPELVKQLYKLNLSLLCVGLMQRHLKTTNRTTTDTSAASKKATATAAITKGTEVPEVVVSDAAPTLQERAATPSQTRAGTDTSPEKTYELLEAMEFMDIGTGILTVKTELAEDTDRLFTLVGDVLAGFLTSIHVLTESNFNKLFVTESETINTWANYQRLIGMLVEQLILRSYVSYLEKEAAQQMEQLLLEVSLEDKAAGHAPTTSSSAFHSKKKSKKKKKKKSVAHTPSALRQTHTPDTPNNELVNGPGPASSYPEEEPISEPMPEPMWDTADCLSNSSTAPLDDAIQDADEETTATKAELPSKKLPGLNPNALVFQPQETFPIPSGEDFGTRASSVGKRKFDEYIISVPLEDVISDVSIAFDSRSIDGESEDEEVIESVHDRERRRWRKQRRCKENAELEWQLQQVYASTSSLFGWDFTRQCERPDPGANLPWSESTLWRTAPKEVVRYFSPGNGDAYSRFQAPHFLPSPSGPPPSRYYFNPGPPMPFGPPLLPPPGMEPMPHLQRTFGFQPPEFPMVVSSPDFSNAQYHPSNHEDQVDV